MNNSAVLTTRDPEQSQKSDVVLAAALLELLTVAQSNVELDRGATKACLSRAAALLSASLGRDCGPKVKRAFRGGLPQWQAKRLIAYIEENLDQSIRSTDLILLTGISPGHFFRSFKETFGQAPFTYIAGQRVKHAKHLMLTTNQPLSQIALDCGLCDQSHLTRLFRRFVGTTPSDWRRTYVCGRLESRDARTRCDTAASLKQKRPMC